MAEVIIPTALQAFTDRRVVVSVDGISLRECLAELCKQYASLQPYLDSEQGTYSNFINFYLNGKDTRYLPRQWATPVSSTDKIELIMSMAGG
jgi:molybdopterin converting factor small subunit